MINRLDTRGIFMFYKPPRESLEMYITTFQATIVSPFIQQILANLYPTHETPETQRRRQEVFQAALVRFCENIIIFERAWQQYINLIRTQHEEEMAARDEKMYRERRIQENMQIENRLPTIPVDLDDEKQRDRIAIQMMQLEKAIHFLSGLIKELDESLEKLRRDEKNIRAARDERIKNIRQAYQSMAKTEKVIEIQYLLPPDSQGNRQMCKLPSISVGYIENNIGYNVTNELENEKLSPHIINNREAELLNKIVDQHLESHSEKKLDNETVNSIKQDVESQFQKHRQAPENLPAKNTIQNEAALLVIDQLNLDSKKGAIECAEMTKNAALTRLKEAAARKKALTSAPKNQPLEAINSATFSELTSTEKSMMKVVHSAVNDIPQSTEKLAATLGEPKAKVEREAANSPTFPETRRYSAK